MSEDMEIELQEDVLIEILARLPVKSLIRFTCVCKYWLTFIRSPEFASKHHATRSGNDRELDSLLTTFPPASSISIISCENLTFETAFKFRPAVECEPPRFGIDHHELVSGCAIYGPCNGLFLLYLRRGFENVILLWNPATREVFRLPNPIKYMISYFGFGFDEVTNDYKVVCFYYVGTNSIVVQLYSLAANSWWQVDDAGFSPCSGSSSAGFNFEEVVADGPCSGISTGRMHHWMSRDVGYDSSFPSLLSFDMVDEVFVETPLPDKTGSSAEFLNQYSNDMYPTLYYMDDTIEFTRGMHIWVLKEYGPTGFWNKQQYITLPEVVSSGV
ncbi:F-box/kelch-repeat protein At3g06240 [Spinacia oleracea]|uniref:F-box/kelch-repeat protein At3g06240 n=1 Tax=Spinacia oleracea TaxID=3562 RepID=A0ABM3RHA9_SPIOL|nr:F-box/kelch-repeat protein At3g06240-like [Spinacia oleracea]